MASAYSVPVSDQFLLLKILLEEEEDIFHFFSNEFCDHKSVRRTKRQIDNNIDIKISGVDKQFILDLMNEFVLKHLVIITDNVIAKESEIKKLSKILWIEGKLIQVVIATTHNNQSSKLPLLPSKGDGFFMLLDDFELYLEVLSGKGYFNTDSIWFIKLKDTQDPRESMSKMKLKLDSLIYLFAPLSEDAIKIEEIYKVGKNIPITVSPLGIWDYIEGFSLSNQPIWERRKNLSGLMLDATSDNVGVHTSTKRNILIFK